MAAVTIYSDFGAQKMERLLRRCSLVLWVATPDLGRGVAPLAVLLRGPSQPRHFYLFSSYCETLLINNISKFKIYNGMI